MDSGLVRDAGATGNPRFSLRHYLIALVLAAVLPTIAVVTLAVWHAGTALRGAATSLLLDSAITMSGAIERELGNSVSLLAGIPRIDWVGLSPTVQSVLAQLTVLAIIMFGFWYNRRAAARMAQPTPR